MDLTVVTYVVYLLISLSVTLWVGRVLAHNGRLFLVDVLHGDTKLAHAVNQLLLVGFYLVNFGFIALHLKLGDRVDTARESFEALSVKVGTVLLVLGALHLANVFVLNRLRRRTLQERMTTTPPVPPQAWTSPAVGV
ncbi:hypothetical protein [Yinghuangia seranimata]|uniref:hypothetical protein n=1 Tax=Yinghuangia seranimata TaxID=408067 RepID=UPI00248B2A14|nr:hypothetical protein [Yinghuangia seranimata]MDI2128441.1 hypothetical protein [Yinghuangia seranimata]